MGSRKGDKVTSKLSAEPEGYAECYPGFEEMNDALEDSDDEADYSKMDLVSFNDLFFLSFCTPFMPNSCISG